MSLLLICGSHPRHRFLADVFVEQYGLGNVDLIVVGRENLIPEIATTDSHERDLLDRHFQRRLRVEAATFGTQSLMNCETGAKSYIHVDPDKLNTDRVGTHIRALGASTAILIGPLMIRSPVLELLPIKTLNVHLGLSPRYRGSATLFWPSYFLEPWYLGCTVHFINEQPDAGAIVHQSGVSLSRGMDVHECAVAAITQLADDLYRLAPKLTAPDYSLRIQKQSPVGKTFLVRDFRPVHLVPIYDLYDGRVLDAVWPANGHVTYPQLFQSNLGTG